MDAVGAEAENGDADVTKDEIRKVIEDYFADSTTTKADMEELVALITGLIENHDWSVESEMQTNSPIWAAENRLIKDCHFTTRVKKCLSGAAYYYPDLPEVRTIGDLLKWQAGQLLRIPNFGRRSLDEVENFLAQLGLRLSDR
jgi:DNA-directed RNA polymerase alpha subunit